MIWQVSFPVSPPSRPVTTILFGEPLDDLGPIESEVAPHAEAWKGMRVPNVLLYGQPQNSCVAAILNLGIEHRTAVLPI